MIRSSPESRSPESCAFISHYDCARHDTGWSHPDHQGRLPAVMRAVYADMLTLFPHLVEVEGRHASEEEMRLVHDSGYLDRLQGWVRSSAESGTPLEVEPGIVVSGASWAAARAAAGCVLTAVTDVVGDGPRRAFCASRPPGAGAHADRPGGFGLVNSVAIGARYVVERLSAGPVLVVEWRGTGGSALTQLLAGVSGIRTLTLEPASGIGGSGLLAELRAMLAGVPSVEAPALILLANGLDILATDPVGTLEVVPAEVYEITRVLCDWADRTCDGRIVSVLEGGYGRAELGAAAVQHLRALTGLPRAA